LHFAVERKETKNRSLAADLGEQEHDLAAINFAIDLAENFDFCDLRFLKFRISAILDFRVWRNRPAHPLGAK
jgi:hypothetical protein